MARVINGLMKGRLGGVIYKIHNGKQYACSPPVKVKQPDNEESRSRLSLFGCCCAMNAAINKVLVFSESWKKSRVRASSNPNKMMIINRPRIKPGYNISGIWLVDDFRYSAELKQINFSEDGFTAVLSAAAAPGLSKLVSLQGIAELLNPVDPSNKPYKFFPFVSPDYTFTPGTDITFSINFSSQNMELLKLYSERKILFNLAYKDIGGMVMGFTGNIFI